MFRFTICEMLLMIVIAGLAIGWTMEHRQLATVRKDAEALARYGEPAPSFCGFTHFDWLGVAERYGYTKPTPLVIVEEDDEENERRLGFSIAE